MATRRMFSKEITNSSAFLMMPESSSYLYFQLGMNADDDGFCEHFTIMRMVGAKPDDLKILQAKGFVQVFDDKVLVITDWKVNNFIRGDRYTESKYLKIYKEEIEQISRENANQTLGIPDVIPLVDKRSTEVRLGKDRIGKNTEVADGDGKQISEIIDLFKDVNPAYRKWFANTTQRAAVTRLIEQHGVERVVKVIGVLQKSNGMPYMPTVTTPAQLEDKWAALSAGFLRKKGELQNKHTVFV